MAEIEPECIFCRMASGEVPVEVLYDGGDTLFFFDRSPKAKIHVLGIPKKHIPSLAEMTASDQAIVGKLLHDMRQVAEQVGLTEGGFRVTTNIGKNAGQVVRHLHFHLLGGEPLSPLN
jgi:histidine triad (HIT) family protein